MLTKTNRRGKLRWRGVVKQNGKIAASRWFGSGKKEYRKAVVWEEETRKWLREEAQKKTLTASLSFLDLGNEYLSFSQRRHSQKTYKEKDAVIKRFFRFAAEAGWEMDEITPGFTMKFLQAQFDARGGNAANKDRKNLAAAWQWGRKYLDGFPRNQVNPFSAVDKFPQQKHPRYVPPIEDLDKVLAIAEGQDHVMLTAFLHLAARRGEIFRLTWQDVNFEDGYVFLSTRKTRNGSMKRVMVHMSTELRRELLWWWGNRPFKRAEHVLLEESCSPRHNPGEQFKTRQHFMKTICRRAKVKPFGFHAIRHLSASYLYKAGESVSTIQKILGHEAPSTTERYLKSLGFETEKFKRAVEKFSNRGGWQVVPFLENEKTPRSGRSGGMKRIPTRDIHHPLNERRFP